jgi:hypothetical protein
MCVDCIKIYQIFTPIDNVLCKIWNVLFNPMHFVNVATNFVNKYHNGAILSLATSFAL